MAKKNKNSIEYLLRGELGEKKKTSRKKRKILNYAILLLAAAVLGYAFYAFFFCTVFMSGPSMEGTLHNEDELILSRFSYLVGDIERYDEDIYFIWNFNRNYWCYVWDFVWCFDGDIY